MEAQDVGLSSECLVAPIGSKLGATFEKLNKDFQNSAPILTLKVGLKARKLVAMRLG